jgi:hypothetical protein
MITPPASAPRPRQVGFAIILLYIVLTIGVVRTIADASATVEMTGIAFMLLVLVLVFGTTLTLIMMISNGKNWARITFLILFVLGFVPAILGLLRFASNRPISALLGLAQIILQLIALIFLFQPEPSDWFRDRSKHVNSKEDSKPL